MMELLKRKMALGTDSAYFGLAGCCLWQALH